jgi:uncharacterized OB-fold protein
VTSGRGRVATWTLNRQQWLPGFDPPYLVALVELAEQRQLRLMTNLVNCDPDGVYLDMPVRARFERYQDEQGAVWIPLFEPDSEPPRHEAAQVSER